MMAHWSTKRLASLVIHTTVVLVPFGFSTVSALLFWHGLFVSWWLAAPMVVVVDILALLGLVLYVVRIPSPFVWLRHLLPFISIVPLGLELYALLEHNGPAVAGAVTLLVTSILVAIAWQCFRTIERLFIDPIEAAREKAREQVGAFSLTMAQLAEMNEIVDTFAVERMRYHAPTTVTVAKANPKALQVRSETTQATFYSCPNCRTELTLGAYGAAVRHGHCKQCKEN